MSQHSYPNQYTQNQQAQTQKFWVGGNNRRNHFFHNNILKI